MPARGRPNARPRLLGPLGRRSLSGADLSARSTQSLRPQMPPSLGPLFLPSWPDCRPATAKVKPPGWGALGVPALNKGRSGTGVGGRGTLQSCVQDYRGTIANHNCPLVQRHCTLVCGGFIRPPTSAVRPSAPALSVLPRARARLPANPSGRCSTYGETARRLTDGLSGIA